MAAPAIRDLDARLMLRLRDGDFTCFSTLIEEHRSALVRFLYRMVTNQAIAEELAQEVFLRVYRSRDRYEPSAKFTTWLFRISTNPAFNWLRDEKHERSRRSIQYDDDGGAGSRLVDRKPSVENLLVHRVKLNEVREAISKLPAKQRAAVVMHKYQEMDYVQISRVLTCSESDVKSLLFTAYENLRAKLAHYA